VGLGEGEEAKGSEGVGVGESAPWVLGVGRAGVGVCAWGDREGLPEWEAEGVGSAALGEAMVAVGDGVARATRLALAAALAQKVAVGEGVLVGAEAVAVAVGRAEAVKVGVTVPEGVPPLPPLPPPPAAASAGGGREGEVEAEGEARRRGVALGQGVVERVEEGDLEALGEGEGDLVPGVAVARGVPVEEREVRAVGEEVVVGEGVGVGPPPPSPPPPPPLGVRVPSASAEEGEAGGVREWDRVAGAVREGVGEGESEPVGVGVGVAPPANREGVEVEEGLRVPEGEEVGVPGATVALPEEDTLALGERVAVVLAEEEEDTVGECVCDLKGEAEEVEEAEGL
jgi:hypothetical protein